MPEPVSGSGAGAAKERSAERKKVRRDSLELNMVKRARRVSKVELKREFELFKQAKYEVFILPDNLK